MRPLLSITNPPGQLEESSMKCMSYMNHDTKTSFVETQFTKHYIFLYKDLKKLHYYYKSCIAFVKTN